MALLVQKYGGTSVGTIGRIQNVARRAIKSKEAGNDVIVVVSAMSGETNRLLCMAKEIDKNHSSRETDVLLSTGEQVTISLLSMAIQAEGHKAISYTGYQVPILTDSAHGKARIDSIDEKRIKDRLTDDNIVIVAGFQGIDSNNNITTLGRGGSDTTAVALAAALSADECQIYTDVDGVYTTDPRVVQNARKMDQITFEEMLEMASLGSKVLQIRAVEFAGKYNVPLRVLSSFEEDGEGTLITYKESKMEAPVVSGIAFTRDEAQIKVANVIDKPGSAALILGAVAEENIDVDMIVQNSSKEGFTDFTFTVLRNDVERALVVLEEKANQLGENIFIKKNDEIAKVSLVGVGMKSHAGVAYRMFNILAKENINIKLIGTSEIKISVTIDEKYLELAVRALHEGFGLEEKS